MNATKLFKLPLLLIPVSIACSEESEEVPDPASPNTFSANIEGTTFESGGEFVAAELSLEENGLYILGIEAFDYEDINLGRGQAITLSVSGNDVSTLRAGAEFRGYDLITGTGVIGLYLNFETYENSAGGSNLGSDDGMASVTITAHDPAQRRISGEFSFTAYDNENERFFRVTEGRFNQLEYTLDE